MKRDPYKSKEKWDNWIKDPKLEGLKFNQDLIINFLKDFEQGKNISKSSRKGQRSSIRLMALKSRLNFFCKHLKQKFTTLSKDDVHELFNNMRNGILKREDGKNYISTGSYVKDWKTFWSWLIKTNQVKFDINEELDRTDSKPSWVYLDEEKFKTLANRSNSDYKPLIWLMLDSGARVTEAYNLRVCDFEQDFTKVTIRAETSKNNYERTINLKLCSNLIKDYVKFYNLKDTDFLFQKKIPAFNKYLKELCTRLFDPHNKGLISHPRAKGKYSEFTLYDIRHNASCYWLKRYSTHRALMYRMAWTSERFIKYYSEFLGQEDKISDEDMISEEDKTKLVKLENEYKKLSQGYVDILNEITKMKKSINLKK